MAAGSFASPTLKLPDSTDTVFIAPVDTALACVLKINVICVIIVTFVPG
jgi:hypothetical protein